MAYIEVGQIDPLYICHVKLFWATQPKTQVSDRKNIQNFYNLDQSPQKSIYIGTKKIKQFNNIRFY